MESKFYDDLTPFYHLIYADWESSIRRQASNLQSLIHEFLGTGTKTILDVACGIGTQALGLAHLGYAVKASDLSPRSVERAKREAEKRELQIDFSVADMRSVFDHHRSTFDVVIACDNAVPHLLSDSEILAAFKQFYMCTAPGGACIVSVRDYAAIDRSGLQLIPFGVRREEETYYVVLQVWEFHGPIYDLSMYFVEDRGEDKCETHVMRSKYYAVTTDKLVELMTIAGYERVQRLDERFFQPVIISTRPR